MGLCKCPKKKVTTLFCFEHRVNVCEDCTVSDHPSCVVQSYLHWLADSDYNPVCRICEDQLATGECIRLVCYDVFHKECLNDWASCLSPHTAPAGYKCPVCSSPVFPASNLVSPIADHLRKALAVFPWARTGLGLPLINDQKTTGQTDWSTLNGTVPSESETSLPQPVVRSTATVAKPLQESVSYLSEEQPHIESQDNSSISSAETNIGTASSGNSVRVTAIEDPPVTPSQFRGDSYHSTGIARKSSSSETRLQVNNDDADADENKYKRRSAIEWFSRWWRTMSRPSSRHHQTLFGGKRRMILILVLLACVTLLAVFSYLGKGASDDDPLLNPFNNPNIRVEDD